MLILTLIFYKKKFSNINQKNQKNQKIKNSILKKA